MKKRIKKLFVNLLRLSVCVAALWYVLSGVTLDDKLVLKEGSEELTGVVQLEGERVTLLIDGRSREWPIDQIARDADGALRIDYGLKTAWRNSTKILLLFSLVTFIPVPFLQGARFKLLLMAQEIHLGWWECVKISFAGNFLNFAAPIGSTGGDVFKAYYVSLHTHHKTEAVTTVFLDRFVGLFSLVFVVAAVSWLAPVDSRLTDFRLYTLAFFALGAIGGFIYLTPRVRSILMPAWLIARLPMRDQLVRIDQTTRTLAQHKMIVITAILMTFVLQASAILASTIVAKALGMSVQLSNMLEFYAYFATGAVVQALPGPPQGFGTVELAYSYFFRPFGSQSQILCMALGARLVPLAVSLPGLLITLTGAYRPKEVLAAASIDDETD